MHKRQSLNSKPWNLVSPFSDVAKCLSLILPHLQNPSSSTNAIMNSLVMILSHIKVLSKREKIESLMHVPWTITKKNQWRFVAEFSWSITHLSVSQLLLTLAHTNPFPEATMGGLKKKKKEEVLWYLLPQQEDVPVAEFVVVVVCPCWIFHQAMFEAWSPMVVTCFAFSNVSVRLPCPLMKLLYSPASFCTCWRHYGNIKTAWNLVAVVKVRVLFWSCFTCDLHDWSPLAPHLGGRQSVASTACCRASATWLRLIPNPWDAESVCPGRSDAPPGCTPMQPTPYSPSHVAVPSTSAKMLAAVSSRYLQSPMCCCSWRWRKEDFTTTKKKNNKTLCCATPKQSSHRKWSSPRSSHENNHTLSLALLEPNETDPPNPKSHWSYKP